MKLVISSSCKFSEDWPRLVDEFEDLGASVYAPKKEDLEGLSQTEVDRVMETVNRNFYAQIDTCDALYIYCPKGYIGKGVASEIGYAIAKGKDVVASDIIDDLGIWSLVNKVKNIKEFKEYLRSTYGV
jgi:nucleoside 2-deoxyribosyltransferase